MCSLILTPASAQVLLHLDCSLDTHIPQPDSWDYLNRVSRLEPRYLHFNKPIPPSSRATILMLIIRTNSRGWFRVFQSPNDSFITNLQVSHTQGPGIIFLVLRHSSHWSVHALLHSPEIPLPPLQRGFNQLSTLEAPTSSFLPTQPGTWKSGLQSIFQRRDSVTINLSFCSSCFLFIKKRERRKTLNIFKS